MPAAPSAIQLPAPDAPQLVPVALTADAATARPLANRDVREPFRKSPAARETALADFCSRRAEVSVDLDPITGSPKWIASETGLLTGPAPDAEAAVLGGAAKTKDYVTEHNGIRTAALTWSVNPNAAWLAAFAGRNQPFGHWLRIGRRYFFKHRGHL